MAGSGEPSTSKTIQPAALPRSRHLATREGWCYQHVQAITVAIDQYAEKALGNREYVFTDR